MEKGYSGEDVYSISGGNPFYVNEILASYCPGVPDNIKDSILAVYERKEEGTKHAWQNNHHLYPGSARAGFLPYQIDFAWVYIQYVKVWSSFVLS